MTQIPEMADETALDVTQSNASDSAGPTTRVQLRLLGESSMLADGNMWMGRAAQNRRLAILVVLAAAPSRRMTRPAIQALLWPDADLESARRLLNEAVYVIRKELGAGALETRGEYLMLGANIGSDVEAFRSAIASGQLDQALDRYAGPFLGSWAPPDMPEFERWSSLERETLARQHRDAVLRLAAGCETAGDWTRAAERYQQLLDVDRFSVQAAVGLSRALAAQGEPLRGLKVIDTIAGQWREEFGEQLPASLNVVREELLSTPATITRSVPAPSRGRVSGTLSSPSEAGPVASTASTESGASVRVDARPVKRSRRGLLVGGLVVVAASVLAFALGPGRNAPERIRTSRLAIAPFDVAPEDSDVAFVATGLGESLAGSLGTLTGLQLIAPEALTQNAGTLPSLDSIARRFGEPLLLRGTVERARDEISVTVRIIDSRTGEQVASTVTTTSAGQLASLRQEFVARVAVAVRQRIGLANERDVHDAWERLGIATAEGVELTWRAQHRIRALVAHRLSTEPNVSVRERARRAGEEADSLLALAERSSPQWREPTLLRARLAWERARLEVGPARLAEATVGIGHAERAIAVLDAQPGRPAGEASRAGMESSLRREQLARAYFLRGTLRLMTGVAMATWRSENGLVSAGERDLERAVGLDSMLATAWAGLARPRWMRADFSGAYLAAQKAVQMDPFGQSLEESISWAARSAAALGDRDGTLHWCRRGRAEVSSTWRFLDCELQVHGLDAAGLGRTPDPASAWALVDTLERLDVNAARVGRAYSPIYRRLAAAAVSAAAGDTVRARRELQNALMRVAGHSDMEVDVKYDAAFVLATLGEGVRARAELLSYGEARPAYATTVFRVAKFRAVVP